MRKVSHFLLVVWLVGELTSYGDLSPLSLGGPIKGLVVPFYRTGQQRPAAIFRAKSISKEFERRGFFRIGLLPVIVGDGVTLELREPSDIQSALQKIQDWLCAKNQPRPVELRRVKILFPEETTCCFQAGRIRILPSGQWLMSDGVAWQSSTNSYSAPRSRLHVMGPQAGQLIFEGVDPPVVIHLFADQADSGIMTRTKEIK